MTLAVEREAASDDLRTWPTWDIASVDIGFPSEVSDASPVLLVDQVGDALSQVLESPPGPIVLLSVEYPDLTGLAWERLEQWLGRQVVRYAGTLAARAYEPADVPLSILVVDVDDEDGRFGVISRYFRSVVASRQPGDGMEGLVGGGRFDIVHLGVRVAGQDGGSEEPEVQYADGSAIDEGALARALDRAETRLLVLEFLPPTGGPAPMTNALRSVTHRLHEATGIAAIASGRADFRRFYYDLTHDSYLTNLVRAIEPVDPGELPALWVRKGGDGALRLRAASARLGADVVQEHLRVDAAYRAQLAESAASIGASAAEFATIDALERLARLREQAYSFDQESLGVVPMDQTRAELDDLQRIRASRIPEPSRVLNAWIESSGRALPPSTSLATGSTYQLAVTIGRPDRRSATAERAHIDELALSNAYVDGIADLTVVVSSNDVVVDRPRSSLRLRLPPADSETVLVTLSTPFDPGSCRLRIGVYHRTNLLQSLIMTLTVGGQTDPSEGPGYRAALEWALSSTFQNLDEMDEPALAIVTNEDPRGSHTFVVYAAGDAAKPDVHRQLDIAPGQLKTAVDDARNDLQKVCASLRNGELDRYRYRDDRPDIDRLLEDLKALALGGSGLFGELTSGSDEDFNAQLENRLRGSKLIQIAAVRSANYVFPWSLVYDHEFRLSGSNVLCDVASEILTRHRRATADDLAASECFTDECPYRADPRIVCPAGFWGFRHLIEQPLLTAPAIEPVDRSDENLVGGTPRHDVTTRIPLRGGNPPRIVIGVSETLSDWSPHAGMTAMTFGSSSRPESSIDRLLDELRHLDLHLAYFYCHGGRRGAKPFLGLGTRRDMEELFPQYLRSVRWPDQHPFVFINGCRTVGVGPDDLLSFNKVFAKAQASGLLGTEIAVPEQLAQDVAGGFFRRFAGGMAVGEAVRQVRLDLLVRCNPLGLAYTPYCMAALRLSA
jgi:hypothetical protein